MTHSEWLDRREPAAPDGLRACLQLLLSQHQGWNVLTLPEAMIGASEVLLARILESRAASRDVATDLLAADACVSYAFEAAADDPRSIAPLAERSMRGIAVVAAGRPGAGVARPPGNVSPTAAAQ